MDALINRQHKDRLFRFIFGESKENALSLYNALNHSNYTDPENLTFTTIGNAIYMGMKNDLSFLFQMEMNLYEHQSTLSPNVPLRGLFYVSRLMEAYAKTQQVSIYDTELLRLPTPHYIVFYNGTADTPDTWELRLSDAFDHPGGCLEVVATVYNINSGRNRELMERCRPLYEYSELIGLIRRNQEAGMSISDAVNGAVDACIAQGILKDVLIKHKSEVVGMLLTEYDEAETMEKLRAAIERRSMAKGMAEGRAKGIAEGRAEGRAKGIAEGKRNTSITLVQNLMNSTGFTLEQAMNMLMIPENERSDLANAIRS